MPGWRSSEIESPNKRSVGRFESLTEKVQEDIITCLNILRINPGYAQKHGLTHLDSLTIAQSLGYTIPESNNDVKKAVTKRLRAELRRYRQNCLRERRLFYEREKPVVLARN